MDFLQQGSAQDDYSEDGSRSDEARDGQLDTESNDECIHEETTSSQVRKYIFWNFHLQMIVMLVI